MNWRLTKGMKMCKKLNILGSEYEVALKKEIDAPKLKNSNGYTEFYAKKIIIEDITPTEETVERLDLVTKKLLRHEIIHAFLFESGLDANSEWARNEEIVDWIAIQFPKLLKAIQEADAL